MQPSGQSQPADHPQAQRPAGETAPAPTEPAASAAAPAPEAPAPEAPPRAPELLVSDRDRDGVAQILQAAFAEGRLDDGEFDERMRGALTARTGSDLEKLTVDLPAVAARPATVTPAVSRQPGKLAVAYKSSVRRGGRWRVPEQFTSVVYKGTGWLDLRAAELTGPETTVRAIAYKSRIDVLVPPGVRVELDGFGVSKGWSEQEELESLLPRDAPVVHVRGVAYKGTIEVSTRPPGPDDEPRALR